MTRKVHSSYARFLYSVMGFFILAAGVCGILRWWDDVVIVTRGAAGVLLALGGLGMMYWFGNKR